MEGITGRSECGFTNVHSSPFSPSNEVPLTSVFTGSLINKSNVQTDNKQIKEDMLTDQSSDISDLSSNASELSLDNSLNQQLSFLNQISITCPGCSEDIKPVFIPYRSHIQTGSGIKQREVVVPTLINNQLGSGKARSKPKTKSVKRINKGLKGVGKKGAQRKKNTKTLKAKAKPKKTTKNKPKNKSKSKSKRR